MTDYITESGTIFWDRAEPFINMLGKHEHKSFQERIKSIKKARTDRVVGAVDTKVISSLDRGTLIKNMIAQKKDEKKVKKIQALKKNNKDKHYKRFLLLKKYCDDESESKDKDIKEKLS